MRNKASLALFDYWNRRRGERAVPLRNDIEPADIRDLLPGLLILERSRTGALIFRLAGTAICAMFGREFKGETLGSLWLPAAADPALKLAGSVLDESRPAIIELIGESRAGRSVGIELVLLPVASGPDAVDRIFGILTPEERPFWIDLDPIIGCITTSLRVLDPTKEHLFLANRPEIPVPLPAPAFERPNRATRLARLRHLTLLDGGLRD